MIWIYIALLFLEDSSFSDDNSELAMCDLSSNSISDSDTDYSITNHVSKVRIGEASKMVQAQATRTRTKNKVKCNRQINHFLKKYGNVNRTKYY
jgi:hypothetical protein